MERCTHAAGETRALAERVGALLEPGDVVVLSGELGTGKTVFAQGIGAGLGVCEPVVSPTFTIMREYRGRVPMLHLDVYRLDQLQEVVELGLDEILDGTSVVVVEWGEAVASLLPPARLDVRLDRLPPEEADDDTRVVAFAASGPAWRAREAALRAAVAAERG